MHDDCGSRRSDMSRSANSDRPMESCGADPVGSGKPWISPPADPADDRTVHLQTQMMTADIPSALRQHLTRQGLIVSDEPCLAKMRRASNLVAVRS